MDGSVFEEKSSFKMLGSKLDWGSYVISMVINCLHENSSFNSFDEVSFS